MLFNVAADLAKLSLYTACAYFLLTAYARLRRPQRSKHLTRRRLAVWGLLTLVAVVINLIEDVVNQETGPVEEAILWFVRGSGTLAHQFVVSSSVASEVSSERTTKARMLFGSRIDETLSGINTTSQSTFFASATTELNTAVLLPAAVTLS